MMNVPNFSCLHWQDGQQLSSMDQTRHALPAQKSSSLDTESLDDFLASVERRAWQMAMLSTQHRDEALDIVQDTMLAFVRNYSGRPSNERRPLFYRILSNKIHDWGRRQQSWKQRFTSWLRPQLDQDESIDWEPADAGAGPEQTLHHATAVQQVQAILAQLPARQREAFLLREWEGLNVADTAQAMGVSVGSVKTHHYRATQKLRDALEEYR